jgi:3-oxoadipate enol-lactonase
MRIQFEDHGKGIPLVLLHAFPLSRGMWRPQKEALASENVRLILPDLRGFGETKSQAHVATMEEMAQDVAELLDDLKIEKSVIGGLSMGGYVSFALFRLKPELFSGLILCDTTCAPDTEEKRENRFKLIGKIEESGSQVLIDNMLPVLVGEFTKENNRELLADLEKRFADTEPQAAIAALRGMAERKDNTDLLLEIDVPTIFIFGEDDALTDPETGREMHSRVNGSELCIIKKSGHYSNLEQPEQFNKALISFIEKQ